MASAATPAPEEGQFKRRDALIKVEKEFQAEWQRDKLFEVNAPATEDTSLTDVPVDELRAKYPKFFGTYPFSYQNGSLHLGHAFTISKIEFATGYERLKGKRALFPVAYHCTGMPIKAASDKLIREVERFGTNFERYDPENEASTGDPTPPVGPPPANKEDASAPRTSLTTSNSNPAKSTKSKVAAKTGGAKYQFQLMESIGIPREEIAKFTDPAYWLEYFPPVTERDLNAFGARVDWRRSFITTDANPYFDAFVRWQMNKLHAQKRIKYGKRFTIWSQKDGQPCMDHDRSDGEGKGPQEYVGIKLEVTQWGERAAGLVEKLAGKKVNFVAATLRPETMYGQTNCFVSPTITYGLYPAADGSLYLCTARSARNMAFQGILEQDLLKEARGDVKVKSVAEVSGADLLGTKVKAPYAVHGEVYILPMETVLATKGTGVVTSVPSDSPDDWMTLQDLRKKPEYYKIDASWAALEPVPVLEIPPYGNLTAIELCKKFKIASPKDAVKLAEAKAEAYQLGFYSGKMVIGKYEGQSVEQAKSSVRDDLIREGLAFSYAEPEAPVVSRSGDDCVVALVNQWYLDYGETEWRKLADECLANMETYSPEIRADFEGSLNWIHQWACARTYGLGSRLPWDPQYLVESLSDSTIYMAYYTIAHLLHGPDVYGSKPGSLGITAQQMTDEVWDYVFTDGPFPKNSPITKEQGLALRREFTYFYPLEIRSSGKDLVRNHLTFWIYVHTAIFPKKYWPRSVRTNGHLLLDSEKMSKSKGNLVTMKESVERYGADATRMALADAGDAVVDANFEGTVANACILRMWTLADWAHEVLVKKTVPLRTGSKDSFFDRVFENEIRAAIEKTDEAYAKTLYKSALKHGLYDFQLARDWYRLVTAAEGGMHQDLVHEYIRVQALLLSPVAPHLAEHLWRTLLGNETSIHHARWPESPAPDAAVIQAAEYARDTVKRIRDNEMNMVDKKKKGKLAGSTWDEKAPKAIRIFVSTSFPEWQDETVAVFKEIADSKGEVDQKKLMEGLKAKGLIKNKKVMPFVVTLKTRVATVGVKAALNRTVPFDERAVLTEVTPYIKREFLAESLEIVSVEEANSKVAAGADFKTGWDANAIERAEPGAPGFAVWNV